MEDWKTWLAGLTARYSIDEQDAVKLSQMLAAPRSPPQPSSLSGITWVSDGPQDAVPQITGRREALGRYTVLSLLGVGGAGVVYQAWDPQLKRRVAIKVLHASDPAPSLQQRFVHEAQLTAQLEHPGVVPVYALDRLPDGRVLFAMKEIQGETLEAVIRRSHPLEGEPGRRRLRQLVSAFLRVCEAMAYVHSRGMVHRDLKPANIMLGDFGQVLVVDWGLARRAGGRQPGGGTLRYMAPEQASRSEDVVRPSADVYALGAVLYEILTGQPLFSGLSRREARVRLLRGEQPTRPSGLPEAGPLVDACMRALSARPADRFETAAELGEAVSAWLDGVQAAEQATELVAEADTASASQRQAVAEADALRAQAAALLASIPPHASVLRKRPGWALEDAAAEAALRAKQQATRAVQLLQAALRQAPHHAGAHARLAARYHDEHRAAERAGDAAATAAAEAALRLHDRLGRYARYLDGTASLSLETDPPGAEVLLYRYTEIDRRQVPVMVRPLGVTPLRAVPLPPGRYLLELQHPTRLVVRYPLVLSRNEDWAALPGAGPVRLPPPGALDLARERYVPAGWFLSGDLGATAPQLPRRRLWCHGFIMQRDPVTNAEYLDYINHLLKTDGEAEALRWAPQERPGPSGAPGPQLCGRAPDGRFILVTDPDGDAWDPDWPVSYVDWHAARRYAQWRADRDGLPWRLPGELEWERAARGADGRRYPWGDQIDPTWCNNRLSSAVREVSSPIGAYADDVSPFGVRGLAGNVQDWCADAWSPEGPEVLDGERVPPPQPPAAADTRRVLRGGTWASAPEACWSGRRTIQPATGRDGGRGLRLLRPWPDPGDP